MTSPWTHSLLGDRSVLHLGSLFKSYNHATKCGFPGGSDGKESAYHAGDLGLIPGLGRSLPGGGNGNPFQYSCLETLMDRGAWWATVHGVAKSQTLTEATQQTQGLRQPRPCPPGKRGRNAWSALGPGPGYPRQATEAVGRRRPWALGKEGSPSEEQGIETKGT